MVSEDPLSRRPVLCMLDFNSHPKDSHSLASKPRRTSRPLPDGVLRPESSLDEEVQFLTYKGGGYPRDSFSYLRLHRPWYLLSHDPRISPSSRTGAESTEGAEHKSDLPYMEWPRLTHASRSAGCLIPRPRMKTKFRLCCSNASTYVNQNWNRGIGWSGNFWGSH